MYSTKQKGTQVPSDAQAKERLISHIYEFLVHHGAQKTAKSFLEEIHFDKPFPPNQIGEPPGFLFNWWSVFYDLYSSAPERRGQNPHSEEAKAFHDYNFINGPQNNGQMYMNGLHNSNTSSPLGGMPPNDVPMPGNPSIGPTGFFPNSHMRPSPTQPVNQPSPQMMQNQQFMPPRFAGPRGPPPNVRMPQEFNPSGMPGQPMMPTNMDPNRQGPPPSMQQINPRMAGPPGNPRMPMNQFPPSMRPPNCQPNGQQAQPNGQQQMPINMPGGPPGRQWANNNMNYNSPSPGNHYGPPVSNAGPGTPGPGIMASPGSAPYSPANHRMGTPNTVNTGRDSSGVDGMYPIMKQPGQNFVMNEHQQPPNSSPLPNDSILESIKQSPAHVADQSNSDHNNIDYNIVPYQENDQNESAAILKIKESMQEEAKRFEKDTPGELIDNNYYQ